MDWTELTRYIATIKKSRSWGRRREPPPDAPSLTVDGRRLGWYRATAMHLGRRLPADAHGQAAKAGLQDGDPRAALLSLHARVEDITADAWEHPDLVQVWFRYSDYVVPRTDVGVFTIGTLPRDPASAAALDRLADAVHRILDGDVRRTRDVAPQIPGLANPLMIRAVCATGRVHIRWDARTVHLIPVDAAAIDPEEARLELARRFLRYLGPARPEHFSKWAMLSRDDTLRTWSALSGEMVEVDVAGRGRWMLEANAEGLRRAGGPEGVRLLPLGEPYLNRDQDLLVRTTAAPLPAPGPTITQRLINSLKGRVLMDGEIVGAFGRTQAKITIHPWIRLRQSDRARIDDEAQSLERPLGRPTQIRWLDT